MRIFKRNVPSCIYYTIPLVCKQASMCYVNSCCGGVILFWWSFHLFHLFRNFHQPLRKVDYEDIQENWLNGE